MYSILYASIIYIVSDTSGDGTYYYPGGGLGACGTSINNNDLTCAVNFPYFNEIGGCGVCLKVTGPKGSIIVTVRDKCPECKVGDVDLTHGAFIQIADEIAGRVPVTSEVVNCNGSPIVKSGNFLQQGVAVSSSSGSNGLFSTPISSKHQTSSTMLSTSSTKITASTKAPSTSSTSNTPSSSPSGFKMTTDIKSVSSSTAKTMTYEPSTSSVSKYSTKTTSFYPSSTSYSTSSPFPTVNSHHEYYNSSAESTSVALQGIPLLAASFGYFLL